MNQFLLVLSLIIGLLGVGAIGLNYLYLYQDTKNRRAGIKKHVSMVFAVPQILLFMSWCIGGDRIQLYMSGWFYILISAFDPCFWLYIKLALFGRNKAP